MKKDIFKLVRFGFAIIQSIATLLFLYFLVKLDIMPDKYFFMITGALVALCILNIVAQFNKVTGIIMMILGFIITIALIVGSVYIYKTTNVMNKISGADVQIDEMVVYVLNENEADSINDTADYKFGILKDKGREATDAAIEEINGVVGKEISTSEYEDFFTLVDELLAKNVDAIIMNSAYLDVISETEGYEEFESKIKSIHLTQVETKVEWYEEEATDLSQYFELNDDVFTLYISGIDTYGSVSKTSRSDVNIIAVVNTKTKQMLLISTPRDYYVPLSISNGVKDKLTHAGIYGINCSKDTLSAIYELPLQYYFRLNFDGFVKIIDALGGITVNSNESFVTRHGGYTINVGENTLNGEQALGFARERYSLANGDRQRGKNQMEVIKQVVKKMESSSLLYHYTDVMDAISDCFQTSMPSDMITGLVKMQINDMSSWNVVSYSVDGTGTRASTYSMPRSNLYVMVPDEATITRAKELIKQVIDGEVISN